MKNKAEINKKQWSKKEVRKNTNKLARGALVYRLIMFLVVIIDVIRRIIAYVTSNHKVDRDYAMDRIASEVMNSGTASIIAVFIGLLFLLFYFRKSDYRKFIFHSQEKMPRSSFLVILTILMSAQGIFSLLGVGMEATFNQFGFSILSEIERVSSISSTTSMLLYASFIGPIMEEIIFRGFVMRGFQKYGTYYAIFMSAVIFGASHGNLIQSIFAILVGLVFGYVAMKYSIKWSILLHIINNFIFGDLLFYLTSNLSESMQSTVFYAIKGAFFVGAVAMILLKRNAVKKFIKDIKVEKGLLGLTFTSIWLLIFLAFQMLQGIAGIEKLSV